MSQDDSWGFAAGDEIVPGRVAHQRLGGGRSYEAYLAFDETLYSAVVVKVLRPGLVRDRSALRGLGREIDMLGRLAHPVIVRAFDAQPEGERPHVVLEHLDGPGCPDCCAGTVPCRSSNCSRSPSMSALPCTTSAGSASCTST